MADPFIGQIGQFGFSFAPRGWAACQGQLLAISSNTALFALLGTQYGGDGRSTYGLPDLQGRAQVAFGNGPGLTPKVMGEMGGTETITLTGANLPAHTHSGTFTPAAAPTGVGVANVRGTSATPTAGALLARSVDGATNPQSLPRIYAPAGSTPAVALSTVNLSGTVTLATAGQSSAYNNLAPYLTVTLCIALQGVFPQRQ